MFPVSISPQQQKFRIKTLQKTDQNNISETWQSEFFLFIRRQIDGKHSK